MNLHMLILPEFQSIKRVRAARIIGIITGTPDAKIGDKVALLIDIDGLGFPYGVSGQWFAFHKPEIGGYLVQSEGGYTSYSPAKAFEDGYARLSPAPDLEHEAKWTDEELAAMPGDVPPLTLNRISPDFDEYLKQRIASMNPPPAHPDVIADATDSMLPSQDRTYPTDNNGVIDQ